MNTKSTPGPWTIRGVAAENSSYIGREGYTPHAEVFKNIDANARLIAAAPDMAGELRLDLEIFESIRLRIELEIEDGDEDMVFPCRATLGSIIDRIAVIRAILEGIDGTDGGK